MKKNRLTKFWTAAICLLSVCVIGNASEKTKPNVLFIAVDDLNDFGRFASRYPDALTPNLDKLAKRGMVFDNAHCQYPVCGPSRASIMSGLLPSTLAVHNHPGEKDSDKWKDEAVQRNAQEKGVELLHTYFSKNGYKTMAVGKIMHYHVPDGSVDVSGGVGKFWEGTGRLKKNWPQKGTSTDWAMAPERDDQLPDHKAAEWAVQQLKAKQDKPFMLMVGFLRPHVPWYVPKKWFDLYDKEKLTLPPYKADDFDDIPEIAKKINIIKIMPSTEWAIENKQWRNILHAYLACISFVDHQVGKLLDALDESPYADNTIVVLWSDHGYHMGEKNTFQKHSLWERSSHVPFIIAGPQVKGGQRCKRVVSLVDLYPTLTEMCGLPHNTTNEGHSLVPLLKNPNLEWPHPAIICRKETNFAVQSERYRYIRYEDGTEELYDHDKDPNEWTNIADQPEMVGIKAKLFKHMPKVELSSATERE